ARDLLCHRERESAAYIRYLFQINWLDPQHWDLVLNTGRFSVTESVEVVSGIVESGLLEATPTDRQQLGDLAVASGVEWALLGDASVWVSGLRVKAHNGHVRIEGVVSAEEDREAVEQIGRRVDGV